MLTANTRHLGWTSTARIRLGSALLWLGGRIHIGLIDFAVAVEPRLVVNVSGQRTEFSPARRPWLGLLVVALLIAGTLFTGEVGYRGLLALMPVREGRP